MSNIYDPAMHVHIHIKPNKVDKWAVLENKESSLHDLILHMHNLHTQMDTFAQHTVMDTDTHRAIHIIR